MRTITITIYDNNNFDVAEDGKCADRLGWDEMLGQIACMTHPKLSEPHYTMRTPEEWEAWRQSIMKAAGADAVADDRN